jgi:ferric-dicitrate binding protein FerR (iron transport regulator)
MTTDQDRLYFLLQHYASNTSTREEFEELFAIIGEARHNTEVSNYLLETWNNIHPDAPIPSIDWNKMFSEVIKSRTVSQIPRVKFSWYRVAAAIFIVVCGASITYYVTKPIQTKQVTQTTVKPRDITKSNHKLITLPDGSTALLNDNSTLHFPQSFSGNTREVSLNGEAYFDIQRDTSKPFIIHTGKVKTVVLGTAFNIRAYNDESAVTVTVTRGKVKVETEKKILGIIIPNQQISFNTNENEAVQNEVLADSVIVWKQKDLVFNNITFAEAAEMIHKRYQVNIYFTNNKLENCRFTASFLNENTIDQVLKVICDLNNASYTMDKSKFTISGEGCD